MAEITRPASKNERRHIMRHALGFYRALTLSGLYTLCDAESPFDARNLDYFIPALKHCVAAHPILGAAIEGENTENPHFVRPAYLNLRDHLYLVDSVSHIGPSPLKDKLHLITRVTQEVHDQPFLQVDRCPPWKIIIVPLVNDPTTPGAQRMYIIFAYSHSHGDGRSGLAFHKTFLEGLQTAHGLYDRNDIYQPPASPLPPPLEEACNLTITWSYLLLNLLGGYVPSGVCKRFGFQPPATTHTWTGKAMCYDPSDFHTGSEALLVNKSLVEAILRVCRERGVKFTGMFNHLLVHILDRILPQDAITRTFLGQIVVDLRALIPAYSENQMVNCISALYESSDRCHPKPDRRTTTSLKDDTAFWDAARRTTIRLAGCASTLTDQPIGLLRYLDQFRPWFLGKLGKARESSYEISNAVTFDPQSGGMPKTGHRNWDIDRMLFSQPANVTGSALNFQIVTRRGGDMVITLNWQRGVLDVPDENAFAQDLLARVHALFTEICCDCPLD